MAGERISELWKGVRRIIAIRLDNIGDVIMLGPALRAVKAALPDAHLTLMCSPAGSQAAAMLPWVDEIFVWRAVWQDISASLDHDPQRELDLVETLRLGQYDAALIFTSFTQSPHPPAYICYLAGIPIRIGQSKEFGGGVLTHWAKPPADEGHQVDRNLALVEFAGIPPAGRQMELQLSASVQESGDRLLRSAGVDPLAPFVALAPGASATARRYPAENFAEAARLLMAATRLPLVLLGGPRETGLAAPFLASDIQTVSLIGATSLAEMCAILRRAALVIANNSASLHIADAFVRPMVILYSGTEVEGQWGPRFAPARLLHRPVDCSPCYRFTCPYGQECLAVPPAEVVEAAIELLEDAEGISDGLRPMPALLAPNIHAATGKRPAAFR